MKIIVTGGAGFIGSCFVRLALKNPSFEIVNIDKLTYAGNLENLESVAANPRYKFVQADICDLEGCGASSARSKRTAWSILPLSRTWTAAFSRLSRCLRPICAARSICSRPCARIR